ncbi:hypothetical protein BRADI_4g30982v3 [Brachypodium distachyon]|uniref:Uncharacterized protein n=1 Tax=Brachypodium distachyon TaxID=15368 RepID=A0A2K2CRJ6_BRADI|nr:hypothetical protein BRADI_4g30982v3 [Brachypodium distachyon]
MANSPVLNTPFTPNGVLGKGISDFFTFLHQQRVKKKSVSLNFTEHSPPSSRSTAVLSFSLRAAAVLALLQRATTAFPASDALALLQRASPTSPLSSPSSSAPPSPSLPAPPSPSSSAQRRPRRPPPSAPNPRKLPSKEHVVPSNFFIDLLLGQVLTLFSS